MTGPQTFEAERLEDQQLRDALDQVRQNLQTLSSELQALARDVARIELAIRAARTRPAARDRLSGPEVLERMREGPVDRTREAAESYAVQECVCVVHEGGRLYECNRCWARRVAAEKGWTLPPGNVD